MTSVEDARLASALSAIDEANAEDPERIDFDGEARPKQVVNAERASFWLRRLVADPSPDQEIAARAHHLRRWELSRADFEEGRAGYLRWRTEQKRRQVAAVTDILTKVGYEADFVGRVADIISKKGLGTDPEVQAHEDALCLVFLELELDDLASRLGDDRTVEILTKTLGKMSDAAVGVAVGVELSGHARSLLNRAVR
ncbi:MAG: DUF4202 domain-containing protein [Acidimicrobiales bacterium]|nr:DUF4202 domain-containing protein [Acidimicrobiales bacterium]